MGISSLPSPSEGMLCLILANTVLSISLVKDIIRSVVGVLGIALSSSDCPSDAIQYRLSPPETYVEEFRRQAHTIRFGNICTNDGERKDDHECSFCLIEFGREEEVNKVSCGHIFHKDCVEKWLKYWNTKCPLCRNPLIHEW